MKKIHLTVVSVLLFSCIFFLQGCGKNYYGVNVRKDFLNGKYYPDVTEVLPKSVLNIAEEKSNRLLSNENLNSNEIKTDSLDASDLRPTEASDIMKDLLDSIEIGKTTVERKKQEVLTGMFMRVNFENWDDEPIYGLKVKEKDTWTLEAEQYYKHEVSDNFEKLYEYSENSGAIVTMYNNGSYEICDSNIIPIPYESDIPGKPNSGEYFENFYSYYSENLFIYHCTEFDSASRRVSYMKFEEVDGMKTGVILNYYNDEGYQGVFTYIVFEGNDVEAKVYVRYGNEDDSIVTDSSTHVKDGYVKSYMSYLGMDSNLNERIIFDARYLDKLGKIDVDIIIDGGGNEYPAIKNLFLDDETIVDENLPISIQFEYEKKLEEKDILDVNGDVIATIKWPVSYKTGNYSGTVILDLDKPDLDLDMETLDLNDLYDYYGFSSSGIKIDEKHDTFLSDYKIFAKEATKVLKDFRIDLTDELKGLEVIYDNFDEFVEAFKIHSLSFLTGYKELFPEN